ncbi:hypothetical protein [Paenibacillus sp. y28]|uniref:hypothetical protein n=1 Tax=Paenibacillus sp. y28 TaxID=3129110 RepID=UPI003019EB20
MLKKLLQKLLGKSSHYGHSGRHRYRSSSDDYGRRQSGSGSSNHNQYGHGYYKRKHKKSSFSSS